MKSKKISNAKRGRTFIIIGLIVITIIIRITNTNSIGLAPVESFFKEMLYPAQSVTSTASNGFVSFFKGLVDYKSVKDENDKLKAEIGELQSTNSELIQYRVENENLRLLLGIQESNTDLVIVNSEVIGRSIKDWYKTVTINKGFSSGIRENMPVINYSGLIGKVTGVTNSTAEVTLLTDPKYGAITVVTTETGYPGIVIGDEKGLGGLQMIQIPSTANIMEGYEVVTSGLGDLGYKNIKIGKIKKIVNSSDGLMKRAIIEAYADFDDLHFVGVIIKEEIILTPTENEIK
ncbi:MAG: rod shape-determining protein MreC [Fusobacteria bacterium]|nr:MAG: rod shape-determining protein MreC [Fusobacteriota bacterium]KAF0230043.1 MAG: rod shape-determining protein [Fusobacteriota bacterium]